MSMKKDEFLMSIAMGLKNITPSKDLTACVLEAKSALKEAQRK